MNTLEEIQMAMQLQRNVLENMIAHEGECAIYEKVRYMNDKGLKRKFDVESYASRIER